MEQLEEWQMDYSKYRQELQSELQKTSEGFVRIGYLLKLARDTAILQDSQYSNYLDFASGEFGLDKSTVSRFIRINDKYSEGGFSDKLLEQYQGFGYSKLALMLTIPDAVAEELTPQMSKADIQEIKEEIEEEKAISDVEHFEQNAEVIMNPPTESLLLQTITAIGKDFSRIYLSIFDGRADIKEIMMPVEPSTYVTRVPGKGKVILIAKSEGISLTEVRSEAKASATWEELEQSWKEIMIPAVSGKESWEKTYGESFPEEPKEEPKPEKENKAAGVKEKVAPVQQKKPSKVNTPKKEKQPKKEPEKKVEEKTVPIEENQAKTASEKPDFDISQILENLENATKLVKNLDFIQCRDLLADTITLLNELNEEGKKDDDTE